MISIPEWSDDRPTADVIVELGSILDTSDEEEQPQHPETPGKWFPASRYRRQSQEKTPPPSPRRRPVNEPGHRLSLGDG